jgi:hypothetical protein
MAGIAGGFLVVSESTPGLGRETTGNAGAHRSFIARMKSAASSRFSRIASGLQKLGGLENPLL